MSKKFKKNLKALLEVNDRNLFKGLKICKLETYPGQIPEVFQIKKNKVKTSYIRKHICENYHSCSLGPRIVISQVSNSQKDECLVDWKMGVRRSGHIPMVWIMHVR